MAMEIRERCDGCGLCVAVCPNGAIVLGGVPAFRILAALCTECLGYAQEPSCVEVCPREAIVPLLPRE